MRYLKPHFYDQFVCTAGDCPDTCCAGWQIVIDEDSLERYGNEKSEFGKRLRNSIDWEEECFYQNNRRCAFLNDENLCDLYKELGPDSLCDTCRLYPRHTEEYEGLRELSLSLSCPEAARIIPVQAQFLAMRGMAKIMNVIATVQERLNPKLAIGGIVITQFDKRKTLNKSVAELVKDSFCEKVFKTVIRDNVSLAEAPIKGKNIFEYSRNSNGAKDYMALAQEVLKLK